MNETRDRPYNKVQDIELLRKQSGAASDLLKALSHKSRLLILCLLAEREMSVSEIEETVQLTQASVSQQLARLRKDRLVSARREGRIIYYRLSDKNAESILRTLHDIFCKNLH